MSAARGIRRQGGYSLIEALAAVFIMALASAAVVAALPDRSDESETIALALAAKLERASQDAVMRGLHIGVEIDPSGYRFYRRVAGDWAPVRDREGLDAREWPDQALVSVSLEGAPIDARRLADVVGVSMPAIQFDPTGAATPAEIAIVFADQGYRIRLDQDGQVAVEGAYGL